jgi:hypothetical protein
MCSGTLEAQLDEDVKKHEATLEGTSKLNQAAFWPVSVCDAKYFFLVCQLSFVTSLTGSSEAVQGQNGKVDEADKGKGIPREEKGKGRRVCK